MTCVAFASSNRNRLSSDRYSTPSNSLACSWDNFDDNFEDEGLAPPTVEELEDDILEPQIDIPLSRSFIYENRASNFSRSSSVKSNLVYGLFNCAKCKICSCSLVCWVQKRYKTFKIGKTREIPPRSPDVPPVKIPDDDDVIEDYYVTNEAIIRDKLERDDAKRDSGCHGDSSLSYSFNPHEDWSAADNLSWDNSADFLDSFRNAVPYRTIKYVSTPKRLDHDDWISIDEVDDLLPPSAHSSPKTLKKTHQGLQVVNRVLTTTTLTPTKQYPVQVTLKPQIPPSPTTKATNLNSTSRRHSREERWERCKPQCRPSSNSLRKVAIGHRRIERLKEDVAEVRSQIGLALKLCEQVESELNDMRQEETFKLVRPSQMKSLYHRKVPDDCYVWGPLGPGVLRNGYHPNDFWTRQEPPNWLKTSAQHRVFVEEMKYHFKWQQFAH